MVEIRNGQVIESVLPIEEYIVEKRKEITKLQTNIRGLQQQATMVQEAITVKATRLEELLANLEAIVEPVVE